LRDTSGAKPNACDVGRMVAAEAMMRASAAGARNMVKLSFAVTRDPSRSFVSHSVADIQSKSTYIFCVRDA
jgi:hypothetical protein